jgi:uncharacterized cysteine cluster protein YcgN (CxxCxxCC family)
LVSGDSETVHTAGISVRGKTKSEADIVVDDFEDYVVAWPGEIPPEAIAEQKQRDG